ncbi:MAG: LapA family protein [candidate division KSB1 bacterium]|nr:LapA family protein [candidate division KSB1 bacterium]
MWIVRWLLWAVLMLLIIYFAIQNTAQNVTVSFIKWESPKLPLWVVMYLSFAAGVLVWVFASIVRIMQMKTELKKVIKENKKLKEELDQMRNVSIEEEPEVEVAKPKPSDLEVQVPI